MYPEQAILYEVKSRKAKSTEVYFPISMEFCPKATQHDVFRIVHNAYILHTPKAAIPNVRHALIMGAGGGA